MPRRARVLIVDDSAVMRHLLRSVIAMDASLEVAGTAADGAAALQAIASVAPDLILLDVEMPVMDGLTALKRLRSLGYRVPVIMCSSLTQRGARVTIEALACGAADYVAKPAGQNNGEAAVRALSAQLLPRIEALMRTARAPAALPPANLDRSIATTPAVVAIGVSTGGPAALEEVLPRLPRFFPLPIVVVQHMPELFTGLLAERLQKYCALRVCEATEGTAVLAGSVFIARGDHHLELLKPSSARLPPTLHLTGAPLENHCRPSVDVLFRSVGAVYGGHVLAVVLTGMGSDGLAGCKLLRSAGATIVVQDEASSAVWGMPGAVATAGLADHVLPLAEIAPQILRLCRGSCDEARELREAAV
jgi:two-component system chemotaxis response regulator CheB